MSKTDLKKTYKSYYSASAKPERVDLPRAQYISLRGKGDPDGDGFKESLASLYPVAYKIKFLAKAAGMDFGVPPLEGQWWYDEEKYGHVLMENTPLDIPRNEWEYRLLIRMPDFIDAALLQQAISEIEKKKGLQRPECFVIEKCSFVKVLHVGPFHTEPFSLEKIMGFMLTNDLKRNGHHHEIYLSDFRKTNPDRLKTILREPIK